jgi:hypothetical protein
MNKNLVLQLILLSSLCTSLYYNWVLKKELKNIQEARYWISGNEWEQIKQEIYRLDNTKYYKNK